MTIAKCPRCGESLRMGDGISSITCPTCAARITSTVKTPAVTSPEIPMAKTTPRSIARGNPFLWTSIALGILLIAAVATITVLALRRPETRAPVVVAKNPEAMLPKAVQNEPPKPSLSDFPPKEPEAPVEKPRSKPAEFPRPMSVPEKKDPPEKLELRQNVREFLKNGASIQDLKYPLKLGQIGKLPSGPNSAVYVVQVIDDKSMLVNAMLFDPNVLVSKGGVKTAADRITLVMVKGVSTKGATDKAGFPVPHVLEITRTTTYKTAIGATRTVFVLEPLDIESATKLWKSLPK